MCKANGIHTLYKCWYIQTISGETHEEIVAVVVGPEEGKMNSWENRLGKRLHLCILLRCLNSILCTYITSVNKGHCRGTIFSPEGFKVISSDVLSVNLEGPGTVGMCLVTDWSIDTIKLCTICTMQCLAYLGAVLFLSCFDPLLKTVVFTIDSTSWNYAGNSHFTLV